MRDHFGRTSPGELRYHLERRQGGTGALNSGPRRSLTCWKSLPYPHTLSNSSSSCGGRYLDFPLNSQEGVKGWLKSPKGSGAATETQQLVG